VRKKVIAGADAININPKKIGNLKIEWFKKFSILDSYFLEI